MARAGWILDRREVMDLRLKQFAAHWLNGPLPADLMADLADILEDEDYTPEKRAHQIVWQAIKYGMEHTPQGARDTKGEK